MAKYIYPAIFTKEDEGGYSIKFPGLEDCYTQGEDIQDGLEMANNVLCFTLYDIETLDIIHNNVYNKNRKLSG